MQVRALIIDLVLATDLASHFEHVDRVRELAAARGAAAAGASSSGASTWTSPLATDEVDVPTLLSIAIKFADLGHVLKTWEAHATWTARVTEEFWSLGDRERAMGVPVGPLCDRHADTNVPKGQVGFFRFVCLPWYSAIADLVDPAMAPYAQMQANLAAWEERARESAPPES